MRINMMDTECLRMPSRSLKSSWESRVGTCTNGTTVQSIIFGDVGVNSFVYLGYMEEDKEWYFAANKPTIVTLDAF